MRTRSRILELDGLRTIAIAAVLLLHFSPNNRRFEMGWVGVDLFFVISGFLITGILLGLRSDSTPYRKFYWRRVIRIFPPYYAVLAAVAVLAFVLNHETFHWESWNTPLFFYPALRRGISFHLIFHRLFSHAAFDLSSLPFGLPKISLYLPGLGVYWSLAVEELFYLFWAPIVLKLPRKWVAAFAITPIFICPILRGLTHTPDWPEGIGFVTRFDTLAVGACVALLLRAKPHISKWTFISPIIPLFCATTWLSVHCGLLNHIELRSTELFSICGYTLIAFLFGCVVAACVRMKEHPALMPLRLRPIVYIGTISYTIYLTHFFIYVAVARVLNGDLLRALVAASATVAIAAFSWKYFESPILRLRNWPLHSANAADDASHQLHYDRGTSEALGLDKAT
jgi:peptidoglycan/LPS O-acetylase OafA/YrhL